MSQGWFALRNSWAKNSLRNLTTPELRVYLLLRAYRNSGTGMACPSIKTMAKETGIAASSVQVGLDRLEQRGLIERFQARWKGSERFAYNDYRVLDEDQGANTSKQVMVRYRKTGNVKSEPLHRKRGNKQSEP